MNDYISREDTMKKIAVAKVKAKTVIEDVTYYRSIKIIRDMPTADVQPVKHGRWAQIGEQCAKCTACGGVLKSNGIDKTGKALIFKAVYHYCPYCGAKMDGDTE